MFAEFECGRCESRFQVDAEDNDDSVWSLVWRFANAHTTSTCGMLTTGTAEQSAPSAPRIVSRRPKDDGEEVAV